MARSYDHTQTGRFHWIFVLVALGALATAAATGEPERWVFLVMTGIFGLVAASFARMRVYDDGERLRVRFGPLPLWGWSFPYEEITDVTSGQSSLIDGWGIHFVPSRGWTYNLWGRECVAFRLNGKPRRIGTDDARGLAAFLQERT